MSSLNTHGGTRLKRYIHVTYKLRMSDHQKQKVLATLESCWLASRDVDNLYKFSRLSDTVGEQWRSGRMGSQIMDGTWPVIGDGMCIPCERAPMCELRSSLVGAAPSLNCSQMILSQRQRGVALAYL